MGIYGYAYFYYPFKIFIEILPFIAEWCLVYVCVCVFFFVK